MRFEESLPISLSSFGKEVTVSKLKNKKGINKKANVFVILCLSSVNMIKFTLKFFAVFIIMLCEI